MSKREFRLPDGNYILVPEDATFAEADAWGRKNFPDSYKNTEPVAQKEGFVANVKEGAQRYLDTSGAGIGALFDPSGAKQRAQESLAQPQDTKAVSWQDVKDKGIGELPGFIRDTAAQTLPQVGATIAGAKLGSMAGAPLGPVGALVGAGIGGIGANLPSFMGSNIERQVQADPNADVNVGAAGASALGQSALDAIPMLGLLGKLGVGKLAGEGLNTLMNRSAAEVQAKLVKSAQQSIMGATAKGAALGIAVEMPTEVAQAVLERAQAGLPLLTPDALQEYEANAAGAAVIGGPLGAAGRLSDRSEGKQSVLQQEANAREATAVEERKKAREAEALKTKPEYLLDLDKRYQTVQATLQDMKARLKAMGKTEKGTSEHETKIALGQELTQFGKENSDLIKEHSKKKAAIDAAKERARVEGMTPEDYDLERMGLDPSRPTPTNTGLVPEAEAALRTDATAPTVDPVQQYTKQALGGLENFYSIEGGEASPEEVAQALMQDPAMGQQIVDSKTEIPGYDKAQSKEIRQEVKSLLAERERAAKQTLKDEMAQRSADLATQATTASKATEADPLAMLRESMAQQQEEQNLGEQDFAYLDGLFDKALGEGNQKTRAVAVPEGVRPVKNASSILQSVDSLFAERDQADKDLELATRSGAKDAAMSAAARREKASTTLNSLAQTAEEGKSLKGTALRSVTETGEDVTGMGTDGATAPIAGGIIQARKEQDASLSDIAMLIDDLQAGRVLGGKTADQRGSASSTPETLKNQIKKARERFVSAVIREAAITRGAFGKALPEIEALRAGNAISNVFNEWVTRASAEPKSAVEEEVITQPAQMRGTELVRGAETARVDPRPLAERRLGAYREATEVFKDQVAKLVSELTGVKDTATRDEQLLRMQFAESEAAKVAEQRGETAQTRGGELRRRREFVGNLVDKALQRGAIPPVQRALTAARTAIEQGQGGTDVVSGIEGQRFSAGLLDAAEELANRVLEKRNERGALDKLTGQIQQALKPTEVPEEQMGLFDYAPTEKTASETEVRVKQLEVQVAELKKGQYKSLKEGVSAAQRIPRLEKAVELLKSYAEDGRAEARAVKREKKRLDNDLGFFRATARNFDNAPEVKDGRKAVQQAREIKAAWDAIDSKAANERVLLKRRLEEIESRLSDFAWIKEAKKDGQEVIIDEARLNEQKSLQAERDENYRYDADTGAWVSKKATKEKGPLLPIDAARNKLRDQIRSVRAAYQDAVTRIITNMKDAALTPEVRAKQENADAAIKAAFVWIKDLKAELEQVKTAYGNQVRAKYQRIAFEKEAGGKDLTKALTPQIKETNAAAKIELDAIKERIAAEEARLNNAADALSEVRTAMNEAWNAAEVNMSAGAAGAVAFEKDALNALVKQLRTEGFAVDIDKGTVEYPTKKTAAQEQAELRRQKEALASAEKKQANFTEEALALRPLQQGLGLGGKRRVAGKVEAIPSISELDEERAARLEAEKEDQAEFAEARKAALDKQRADIQTRIDAAKEALDAKRAEIAATKLKKDKKPLEKDIADLMRTVSGLGFELENVGKKRPRIQRAEVRKQSSAPMTMRTGTPESKAATDGARAAEYGYGKLTKKEEEQLKKSSRKQAAIDAMQDDFDNDTGGIEAPRDVFFAPPSQSEILEAVDNNKENTSIWYKGKEWYSHKSAEAQALHRILQQIRRGKSKDAAVKIVIEDAKDGVEIFSDSIEDMDLLAEYEQRLAFLQTLDSTQLETKEKYVAPPPPAPELAAQPRRSEIDRFIASMNIRTWDEKNPLHGMTLAEAAKYGEEHARSPLRKMLFATLAKALEKSDGRVVAGYGFRHDGRPTKSFYVPKHNFVFMGESGLNGKSNTDITTLLHELIHAATSRGLNSDALLHNDVTKILNQARAWAETKEGKKYVRSKFGLAFKQQDGTYGIYGLKNVDEFLAETMSNARFQAFLQEIPSTMPKRNLFTRFVDALSKYFGAKHPAEMGLLYDAITVTEKAFNTTARLQGQDADFEAGEGVLYAPSTFEDSALGSAAETMIGKRTGNLAAIREQATGLGIRTRFIDNYAGLKEALKKGDYSYAIQVSYDLMTFAQRNHLVQQAVMVGAPVREKWGQKNGRDVWKTEAQEGANLKRVSELLSKVEGFGNQQATNDAFTLMTLGMRAKTRGWDTVFGDSPKDSAEVMAKKQAARDEADKLARQYEKEESPFADAYKEYQDFNKSMLKFAMQAGVISEDSYRTLSREGNYTPLFRKDKNDNLVLDIGAGRDITVGKLGDEAHLNKLLGDSSQVLDFFTASVRNVSILIDQSLHNIASREAAFALQAMGAAKRIGKNEKSANVIEFRMKGQEDLQRFEIDTEAVGVPTDLVVKGFAGVPASLPGWVRLMGMPATFLRRAVTRNPLYMMRQLVRDPMSAWLTTGADFAPVSGTFKEVGKALSGNADKTLDRRGLTGGMMFAEDDVDIDRIQKEAQSLPGWSVGYVVSKLDDMALAADAVTRRNVYQSALKQGLSEIEATLAAYESMPFSKRGTSPSMRYLNHMVPFLSATIQGWDVLYRSIKGDMPLNERVDVRNALLTRGAIIAGMTMLYAMAMEDDETYKNANTTERLNNWFIPVPGGATIKLPVPFELGIIFKMLPEALVRGASEDKELGKELANVGKAAVGMIPNVMGGHATLPIIETLLNKSLYTGNPIEGRGLEAVDIGQRYDKNTSELSKLLGFDVEVFGTQVGISPKKLEYMLGAYSAGLYPAMAALIDTVLPAPSAEKPDRKLAELPVFKSALQQEDAGGRVNKFYEEAEKLARYNATFKKLLETDPTKAQEYATENAENMGKGATATKMRAAIDKFNELENIIRNNPQLNGAQKQKALENVKNLRTKLASQFSAALAA
jgi:Large polyvalent protein associated domain 38